MFFLARLYFQNAEPLAKICSQPQYLHRSLQVSVIQSCHANPANAFGKQYKTAATGEQSLLLTQNRALLKKKKKKVIINKLKVSRGKKRQTELPSKKPNKKETL